tara:strand:- start:7446 stop:7748 length:303 start_codon:yes stop_codon:yes gene_type:complete
MEKIIKFKDGFSWLVLTPEQALKSLSNNCFSLYAIFDDETESLIESLDELAEAMEQGTPVGIELGFLEKTKAEPWFYKADKILKGGYWYAKISDIKFGSV